MTKAIAFIPEFEFKDSIVRKIKLTKNLYLIDENNRTAIDFRDKIKSKGYKISNGSYLYFEGDLKGDGTLYEIFQGYALALTFFRPRGRATCRALQELGKDEDVQLFIDEYDKFGYEPEDVISINTSDRKRVESIYYRVEEQLENKNFNPLRNSLEFFILFLSEKPIRTRLLYLSICLESVLLEGSSDGLAYKLGIRCANLLNAFYKDVNTNSVYEEIKNGYNLRSKIIHGDDYSKVSNEIIKKKGGGATELDHVINLETIVKDILSVIFSNQELYDLSIGRRLGSEVDRRYVLNS